MAASSVTVTVNRVFKQGRVLRAYGTVALGAGDYATGGLTMNFAGKVPSTKVPVDVDFKSASGLDYYYAPGTDVTDGKIMCFDAYATEEAAGALGAGFVADTIRFTADFDGLR